MINSLYNPLGLVSPVILVGKLLLQQLIIMGKWKETVLPLDGMTLYRSNWSADGNLGETNYRT